MDGPDGRTGAHGLQGLPEKITSGGNRGNTQVGTTGAATSYTDDTVAAEVLYVYTIRADNDADNSGESSPVSITTKAQTEGRRKRLRTPPQTSKPAPGHAPADGDNPPGNYNKSNTRCPNSTRVKAGHPAARRWRQR